MAHPAAIDAMRMLARRELSEAQIRARLARRGHEAGAIDAAIGELHANGSLDDARVARAIARTESGVRKRGRARVRQRLAAAGIAGEVADRAVEEAFDALDEDALIRTVIDKRLAGRSVVADRRELGRLYRHLVARGFGGTQVAAVLRELRLDDSEG